MPIPSAMTYDPFVMGAADQFDVEADLLSRMIGAESAWNPEAVSPKGARGIAQFMPGTAKQYGVDVNDPESSIYGMAHYFSDLRNMFGGDERLAAAAYNAGPGNVKKYGGVPPFDETQNYVDRLFGPDAESLAQLGNMGQPTSTVHASPPSPQVPGPSPTGFMAGSQGIPSAPSPEAAFQGGKLAPGAISAEEFNAGVPKSGFMNELTSPANAAGAMATLATTNFDDPSSIGASAGSIAGGALGGSMIGGAFGGPIGAVAGSFLGDTIGGLFGGDDEEEKAKKEREQQMMIAMFEANQRARMQQMGTTQNNMNAITRYLQGGR